MVSMVGRWTCGGREGAGVMPGIREGGRVLEDWVVCVWRAVSVSEATKRGSTSS